MRKPRARKAVHSRPLPGHGISEMDAIAQSMKVRRRKPAAAPARGARPSAARTARRTAAAAGKKKAVHARKLPGHGTEDELDAIARSIKAKRKKTKKLATRRTTTTKTKKKVTTSRLKKPKPIRAPPASPTRSQPASPMAKKLHRPADPSLPDALQRGHNLRQGVERAKVSTLDAIALKVQAEQKKAYMEKIREQRKRFAEKKKATLRNAAEVQKKKKMQGVHAPSSPSFGCVSDSSDDDDDEAAAAAALELISDDALAAVIPPTPAPRDTFAPDRVEKRHQTAAEMVSRWHKKHDADAAHTTAVRALLGITEAESNAAAASGAASDAAQRCAGEAVAAALDAETAAVSQREQAADAAQAAACDATDAATQARRAVGEAEAAVDALIELGKISAYDRAARAATVARAAADSARAACIAAKKVSQAVVVRRRAVDEASETERELRVAEALEAKAFVATAAADAAALEHNSHGIVSKLTHGKFGEGEHRRKMTHGVFGAGKHRAQIADQIDHAANYLLEAEEYDFRKHEAQSKVTGGHFGEGAHRAKMGATLAAEASRLKARDKLTNDSGQLHGLLDQIHLQTIEKKAAADAARQLAQEAEAELTAVFRDDEAHAATAKSSATRCLEAVTPSDTETESDSGDEDAETVVQARPDALETGAAARADKAAAAEAAQVEAARVAAEELREAEEDAAAATAEKLAAEKLAAETLAAQKAAEKLAAPMTLESEEEEDEEGDTEEEVQARPDATTPALVSTPPPAALAAAPDALMSTEVQSEPASEVQTGSDVEEPESESSCEDEAVTSESEEEEEEEPQSRPDAHHAAEDEQDSPPESLEASTTTASATTAAVETSRPTLEGFAELRSRMTRRWKPRRVRVLGVRKKNSRGTTPRAAAQRTSNALAHAPPPPPPFLSLSFSLSRYPTDGR